MSDYQSRLNSFNQSVQLANKHISNVASVMQDPKATIGAQVETVVGDLGASSSQIAGTIIGFGHWKQFLNMGQNIGQALAGAKQAPGTEPAEGETDMGNEGGTSAANPQNNLGTNAEPTTQAGQQIKYGDLAPEAPDGAPEAAENGRVAAEDDDDGFGDDLMNVFSDYSAQRSQLNQGIGDLVQGAGLAEDGDIMPGSLDPEGALSGLSKITDTMNSMGQAGEDAVNISKVADNAATAASDAASTVSKTLGTVDTIADVGEGIMASSELGGGAAPAVAVVGGLVSLGAEIAKAFTPQTQAPKPPPPVQAPPPSMQVGVNLSQNQGDSGVSHGVF